MTHKGQQLRVLYRHLASRNPDTEEAVRVALQLIGGMAGSWGDYHECTYSVPQRINGVVVDLGTIDKVRAHYDAQ